MAPILDLSVYFFVLFGSITSSRKQVQDGVFGRHALRVAAAYSVRCSFCKEFVHNERKPEKRFQDGLLCIVVVGVA